MFFSSLKQYIEVLILLRYLFWIGVILYIKSMKNTYTYILLLLFLAVSINQITAKEKDKTKRLNKTASTPLLDWKKHNIGNFSLQVTNFGMIGGDNDLFTHAESFINCEYPLNSGIEHLEGGGIWIGAIIDTSSTTGVKKEIKKISTGYEGWGGDGYSTGGSGLLNELYPGISKSDSVLEITSSNQKPDFWSNYYGNLNFAPLSDQDFIAQYTDTTLPTPDPMHVPLGIKVIQRSLSWSSDYMDGIIFVEYKIVNLKKKSLRDIYIGFFMDTDIGPIAMQKELYSAARNYWEDNYTGYIDSIKLAYADNPLDSPSTPFGLRIIHSSIDLANLKFSFHWYNSEDSPDPDSKRYEYLSSGTIMPNQSKSALNDTRFLIGMGPFNFTDSDTVKIVVALVSGENIANMVTNSIKAKNIFTDNYFVPSAPPSPNLTIKNSGTGSQLSWSSSPEDYIDNTNITARTNFNGKTFEGYRIYRAESIDPEKKDFVLLREFDKPDNIWGYNTGLKREIIDSNFTQGKTYSYSVTSYSIEDTTSNHYRVSLESSVFNNMKSVTAPYKTNTNNKIYVVPNPYKADGNYTQGSQWEGSSSTWTENNRLIRFINLPDDCIIRIFTVAGELIKTIEHHDTFNNWAGWNLLTNSGRTIASGIYIYNVESDIVKQTGKFVVIK
jgi:hypothetical protein